MSDDRRRDDRPTVATILVVDDSTAIRRILGRDLIAAGYQVVEAGDGRAALEACRAKRPDLVLLDVDMPILDGHATLIEMRADRDLQSLPVLFLTARTGGADLAAGLELGAQDYLRKPCDAAELTARVAMALRAKAQADAIARHSTTDVLTGLGNRRQMDETVAELTAMHDPGAAVTVIMLDVDHFKAVNDTYGHAVGDVVLKIVAGRLRGALDKGVSVARWGGEEFVVVAVGLGGAQAHALADHVRQAVSHTPFSTGVDQTIIVTVSAGCAIAPLSAFSAALEAADGALYEAKRAGRNCVVVAAPVL